MRILISAGEASGDAYGASLARELRKIEPGAKIEGIGGKRMAAADVQIHFDSSGWGAISIVQGLQVAARIFGRYRGIKALFRGEPGLFIPIDFGYLNIRLAKLARARGWKVLYFVPPASWRRDRQGKDLPAVTDAIVTPFSWSADLLNQMGATAYWFGHPIRQLVAEAHIDLGLPRAGLAVLPGSRGHELEANLPLLAETLRGLPVTIEFALAPSVDAAAFSARWARLSGRSGDTFTRGTVYEVLSRSTAAVVCSGTATLEAALCHCPMVVFFQLTPAMTMEARLIGLKRPKFIALPNILLDRFAVPELVHDTLSPALLRQEIEGLLNDPAARERQLSAFVELETLLGPADGITQTADLAHQLLTSGSFGQVPV